MSLFKHHGRIETNALLLSVAIVVTVSVGGLVEVAPLFSIESTIERVEGVRPYSPLEQAGRDIYLREGCYNCHSQMIRPFKDETERYGHYSLAAESKYDHPFQWGSKRTGPDLARVGGKYASDWHVRHLVDPRSVVPGSVMPGYPHLLRPLDYGDIGRRLSALRAVGVPYDDAAIAHAVQDLEEQALADPTATPAVLTRYPKARLGRSVEGEDGPISEMDALVAYLQVLGTMIDFTRVDPAVLRR